jgi:hypothetical protein
MAHELPLRNTHQDGPAAGAMPQGKAVEMQRILLGRCRFPLAPIDNPMKPEIRTMAERVTQPITRIREGKKR